MTVLGAATSLSIVLAGTALIEMFVLRRLQFDWVIVVIVLAGTVLSVDYLAYTSISERNYDGPSHVEYIQSIARTLRVPNRFSCGACAHPPLYYALAALWSGVVLAGGWMPYELGLQWLSLLLFFGFVVFALLIFRACEASPATLRLAGALVVFWPTSIINSVRVHNDALASLLMLAALYFIAAWDRHGRPRDFYVGLAISALALLTKFSGSAVAVTLVVVAGARLCSTRLSRDSLQRFVVAILVLGAVAVLAVALRESGESRSLCQTVVGHACDGRYVPRVADTPGRYLYFDVPDFVQRMDASPDHPGRDYFWNRVAKSSLFGVMPLGEEFEGRFHQRLAALISLLLLAMVAVCLVAAPFLRHARLRKYRVYLGGAVIMFILLVAFRLRIPNEFHEDFRHIFPALVPLCLGYAVIVERLRPVSVVLHRVGVAVALLMIASSATFFARLP